MTAVGWILVLFFYFLFKWGFRLLVLKVFIEMVDEYRNRPKKEGPKNEGQTTGAL
jgi:hypothetical protein